MSVVAEHSRTAVITFSESEGAVECERDDGEFVNGEFQEKTMGGESEWIANEISAFLSEHCRRDKSAWVLGSNGTFQCYAEAFPDDPKRFRKPDVSVLTLQCVPN